MNRIDAAWAAAFEHALALSCELGRVGDDSGRPLARLAFAAPSETDITSAKSWADTVVEAASHLCDGPARGAFPFTMIENP